MLLWKTCESGIGSMTIKNKNKNKIKIKIKINKNNNKNNNKIKINKNKNKIKIRNVEKSYCFSFHSFCGKIREKNKNTLKKIEKQFFYKKKKKSFFKKKKSFYFDFGLNYNYENATLPISF